MPPSSLKLRRARKAPARQAKVAKVLGTAENKRPMGSEPLPLWRIRSIHAAIREIHRVLRRFFARESRQLTRITTGFRPAIAGLLECGTPSHRFPCLVRFKATRRRVALQKLREMEQRFSLFAFIRVIRGLNFGCGGAALRDPWLTA